MAKKVEAWVSDNGDFFRTEAEALRSDSSRRYLEIVDMRDADALTPSDLFAAFLHLCRSEDLNIDDMIAQIRAEEDL